jgi:hypothetical protein
MRSRLFAPLVWWVGTVPRDPLEQTAWERGKSAVGGSHPMIFGFLSVLVPAALSQAIVSDEVILRVVLTLVAGVIGWFLVPLLWGGRGRFTRACTPAQRGEDDSCTSTS